MVLRLHYIQCIEHGARSLPASVPTQSSRNQYEYSKSSSRSSRIQHGSANVSHHCHDSGDSPHRDRFVYRVSGCWETDIGAAVESLVEEPVLSAQMALKARSGRAQ